MSDIMITDQMINEAESWYNQISDDGVSRTKSEEFKLWFEQNPAHQKAYAQVFMCGEEKLTFPTLPESADNNVTASRPLDKRYFFAMGWGAVAATFLMAAIGLNIYFSTPKTSEYSTQIAEIREILLEDGSTIMLGASSQVFVAKFTNNERRIFLEKGEALFDVVHNARKPFIVESGKTEVQVLGTKFNLNRTTDYLEVSLLEGKIEIQQEVASGILPFLKEEETVTLLPAQMVTIKKGVLNQPEGRKIKQMANWVDGKLNYINMPLRVVIADANRYSRHPLQIKDKSLEDLPVTAVFGANQIDIMVKGLSLILPIKITRGQNGSYIISSKNMDQDI